MPLDRLKLQTSTPHMSSKVVTVESTKHDPFSITSYRIYLYPSYSFAMGNKISYKKRYKIDSIFLLINLNLY